MFFNSVKEINRLQKKINRILTKRMSNIYLKVTRKTDVQNFDILSLTILSPVQFLGSSNSRRYNWIFKFFVAT